MQRTLTLRQINAARLLAWGKKPTEVIHALKLRRETLWRWRQFPEFQKEMQSIMDEEAEEMHFHLRHLAQASLAAVWTEINDNSDDSKRVETALSVIKLLGIERITLPRDAKCAETAPGDYVNTAPKLSRSTASTSVIEVETPNAASEVTPCSEMPQGTMPA